MVVALLGLFVASFCSSKEEKTQPPHPVSDVYNISEKDLDKDKCIITACGLIACGLTRLRFHVAPTQQCFNSSEFYIKSKENIIETNSAYYILTPNFYGSMTKEKFSNTMEKGIKYRFKHDDGEEYGMQLSFLDELLAIELNPNDPSTAILIKEATLIISTGIEGYLGVSEPLKEALRNREKNREIQGYKILRTKYAIEEHNRCVKEGKKVFTFIHMGG